MLQVFDAALCFLFSVKLAETCRDHRLPEPPVCPRLAHNAGTLERPRVAAGHIVRQCEAEVAEEVRRVLPIKLKGKLITLDRSLGLARPGEHCAGRTNHERAVRVDLQRASEGG